MTYTLYTSPGACSMAVHAIMNEIGAPFTLEIADIHKGQTASDAFKKINPRGQVPVLMVEGSPITEGAAQIAYLLDTHTNTLMPKNGLTRAKALEGLMFANATLHPAYSKLFWCKKNKWEDAQKSAFTNVQTLWNQVEETINKNGGSYYCGSQITPADILLTVFANWMPTDFTFGPKTKALFSAVSARPAFAKAMASESVSYKVAA